MANNGRRDFGLAFELVREANGGWHEKVLHGFEGGAAGSSAPVRLLVDSSGNVFGASTWAIFELVPDSNGTWTGKILHNFGGGRDGAFPSAGLTMGPARRLCGTTRAAEFTTGQFLSSFPGRTALD